MIHLYQNNGYNIVLDVNSGAVHVVDKATYDVIGALEEQNELHTAETLKTPETFEFLRSKLESTYAGEDIREFWKLSQRLRKREDFLREMFMKTTLMK